MSFNEGSDFTTSGLQFWYRAPPSVSSVTPRRGPAHGGTKILVRGTNFERSPSLKCKFGNIIESSSDSSVSNNSPLLQGLSVVPATWVSPSAVYCVTPRLEPRSEVQLVTVRSNRIVHAEQIVQTLSLGPGHNITAGTFKLSFGDFNPHYDQSSQPGMSWETTDPIPWNATSSQVADALLHLKGITSVHVQSIYRLAGATESEHPAGPFGTYAWCITCTIAITG